MARHDLLIIVNATASMRVYLQSLQHALPQILWLSSLTGCFERIGVLAYRDYDLNEVIEWSGWYDESRESENPDLIQFVKRLEPRSGFRPDLPEAVKTGLAKAFDVMNEDIDTLVLLYADAPPHASQRTRRGRLDYGISMSERNDAKEQRMLAVKKSHGGHGPRFADWVSACKTLARGKGNEGRAQVFCIVDRWLAGPQIGYFMFLSNLTGGACLHLSDKDAHNISLVTVSSILAWMGVDDFKEADAYLSAKLAEYKNIDSLNLVKDEVTAGDYFSPEASNPFLYEKSRETPISTKLLGIKIARKHSEGRPVHFAKRYFSDFEYRQVVVKHLKQIILNDVTTLALNPVFGDLWRAVCNDRKSEHRQGLISTFGLAIERISDTLEKARMKQWLEDSYDSTGEILEILEAVPIKRKYPFVCLDPTVRFTKADSAGADGEESDREIIDFKRDELLEISRSCNYKILRRLGRVLTRLTYIESESDMPEHLANTTDQEVPKIPMALTMKEYGSNFWKILLHLVVPGTMISARPAALLAALSLRMGVTPLKSCAKEEVASWRDKWDDIETYPETWNAECLSLLIDADRAYLRDHPEKSKRDGLLKSEDRHIFGKLVAYKLLEINLSAPLEAQIG